MILLEDKFSLESIARVKINRTVRSCYTLNTMAEGLYKYPKSCFYPLPSGVALDFRRSEAYYYHNTISLKDIFDTKFIARIKTNRTMCKFHNSSQTLEVLYRIAGE